MLVQEMNVPIVDADTKKDRIKLLVEYFSINKHNHDFYALKFFFCEFLNFINVVGQIYFMDFFLGGKKNEVIKESRAQRLISLEILVFVRSLKSSNVELG